MSPHCDQPSKRPSTDLTAVGLAPSQKLGRAPRYGRTGSLAPVGESSPANTSVRHRLRSAEPPTPSSALMDSQK